ncbi:helix-turn-helix domain-containing protein [Novosphingobium sp. BW1]|uniref:helix-turn-helix domain-containing protein n=1 Tax=Novosphingobium sp. BW1 TaxID=2592621 RepID=UPI0011DEE3BF|nr:helix-turn-helix domain-containing protein [Novosphingobium sp. BW1]TYC81545.1 hypothetical protein FMM79_19715 [Novosphingobium sp. BW1]
MKTPRKSESAMISNYANALSILFASFWPQTPEGVAQFLSDAAFALGVREAELARSLGISRATFSGWKTRGVIPAVHAKWFSEEFAVSVLSSSIADVHSDFRHAGIPPVLHLFRITDFNPFSLHFDNAQDAIDNCYRYFGGLCRLAHFLMQRVPITEPVEEFEAKVGALLGKVAAAAAPKLRFRNVSQ